MSSAYWSGQAAAARARLLKLQGQVKELEAIKNEIDKYSNSISDANSPIQKCYDEAAVGTRRDPAVDRNVNNILTHKEKTSDNSVTMSRSHIQKEINDLNQKIIETQAEIDRCDREYQSAKAEEDRQRREEERRRQEERERARAKK